MIVTALLCAAFGALLAAYIEASTSGRRGLLALLVGVLYAAGALVAFIVSHLQWVA